MHTKMRQVFTERVLDLHAMSISEVGPFYGVDFKQMHEMDDKYSMQADY